MTRPASILSCKRSAFLAQAKEIGFSFTSHLIFDPVLAQKQKSMMRSPLCTPEEIERHYHASVLHQLEALLIDMARGACNDAESLARNRWPKSQADIHRIDLLNRPVAVLATETEHAATHIAEVLQLRPRANADIASDDPSGS